MCRLGMVRVSSTMGLIMAESVVELGQMSSTLSCLLNS